MHIRDVGHSQGKVKSYLLDGDGYFCLEPQTGPDCCRYLRYVLKEPGCLQFPGSCKKPQ